MKNLKGNLLILATMTITLVVWLTAIPSTDITALDKARHILAAIGLNGLFLVFLLSTKSKVIESWFNGLDHVYLYHKYLAIFSSAAILAHVGLTQLLKLQFGESESIGTALAGPSLFLFLSIGFISLVYKKFLSKRVKYELWRFTHRFMLVAYLIGLGHTYLSSKYDLLQINALGIWTGVTSVIGILSGCYIIFLYQSKGFKHKGRITGVKRLSASVIEFDISLDSKLEYEKGQYVFLKVKQNGIEGAPHPFSISGGDGDHITLTVKVAGDYTKQLYDSLEVGVKASLDGPYGHMNFANGKENQLWIAGGIGVTPFLSRLKGMPFTQSVEMYFSYRSEKEEIYKDFLLEYQEAHPNFKVHIIDTSVAKRLDLSDYPLTDSTSVYMCGPAKMMNSYVQTLRGKNKFAHIVYEGFNFI